MSNKLIDILDDEKKVDKLNEDYHYRQSIVPRLEKLRRIIWNENIPGITNDEQDDDLGFVKKLSDDLKDNPQYRLTSNEMKYCNELWKKYK
tara:strand:- start:437 stop:709 length:273 start_codon:yes stop_codon:yes gene_type:complete